MIFSEHFMFLMQKQKIVVMELFCYQNLYNPFFTMLGPENNDKSAFVCPPAAGKKVALLKETAAKCGSHFRSSHFWFGLID